jgi:hypothetical protein
MLNWRELDAEEVELCVRKGLAGEAGLLPTGFLDTHQWLPLQDLPGISISGGFERAQFRMACLVDDAAEVPHFALIDPAALPANCRTVNGLRNLLKGSSLPDSAIGDIYLDDRFVLAIARDLNLDELGIEAEYRGLAPELALREERLTAASLRADAVISAAFRVSRAETQKAIQYGFVYSDFEPLHKRTQELKPGMRLVYRTRGSLDIMDSGINPRSGRSWLSIRRLTQ